MQLLTVKEVAERLKVSAAHVYQMVYDGELAYVQAGKKASLRIHEESVAAWIDKHTVPARSTSVVSTMRKDTPINVRINRQTRQSR